MIEEKFVIKPRIELLEHFSGKIMTYVDPEYLYFINTRGYFYNPHHHNKAVGIVQPLKLQRWMPIPSDPEIDGPYQSMEHMKACSPAYNLIVEPNVEKATEILLKSIRLENTDHINKYFTADFVQNLPFILEHTFIGKRMNGFITGLHFWTSDWRILKYVNSDFKSKCPYVIIEKVDQITGKIFPKKAPTTFWPAIWNIERVTIECAIAWSNKIKNKINNKSIGYTSDGLKITFCFDKNGNLKTVYPDFSNNIYLQK